MLQYETLHCVGDSSPDLKKMLQDTEEYILQYAMQGLRTLCMAKKVCFIYYI